MAFSMKKGNFILRLSMKEPFYNRKGTVELQYSTVPDPDLELRGMGGGGGGVLIYLPSWPFSLLSFLLFFYPK